MTTTTGTTTAGPPLTRPTRQGARVVPDAYHRIAIWLAVASVVVVGVFWETTSGLDQLGMGLAGAFVSLGRLAGLVGADLLLLQVLLMARVPFVERAFGQDQLARWHRVVGFTSFTLMLAHIVLITTGYADGGPVAVVEEFVDLVLHYPGMLMALVATLMIVMVAVTSMKAARRKLRYESWHLLHLYAYLGVGFSVPHELWTGTTFTSSPVATVYWYVLYGVSLAAVLVYRVGLPVHRTLRHRLRVERVVHEGPGVVSVHVTGRDLDQLPVAAGQFFTWRFLDGPGWTRGNPYSLSAAPRPDLLRVTVKDLGDGSGRLAGLRPGTRVWIEGPYGGLHGGRRTRRKVTLLGSGVGITPLRALAESLPYAPGELTVVQRASTEADLTFRAEFDELARVRGARVFYVTGPRRPGPTSWLPVGAGDLDDAEALRQLVPDIAESDVFVCGSGPWMDAAVAAARRAGVPGECIHVERFSW